MATVGGIDDLVTVGGIGDLASCGYCTVKLHLMDDPRMLPCGHVHCSPCMQDHFLDDAKTVVACPLSGCEKEHRNAPIDSMQQVDTTDIELLTCDRSQCVDEPAVNFCIDCGEKLCLSHYLTHKSHFEGDHEVIDIQKYEEAPKKYKKVFCPVHSKEVMVLGCTHCSKLVCNLCIRSEGVCTVPGGSHEYELLEELEREITCEIKEKLRSVEDKIGEMKDVDKETWRRLVVVEEECIECVEKIDRYRVQQVELINDTCERMKKKVEGHLKEMSDKVETFSAQVVDKRDSIQQVYRRVKNIINNEHKADKVTHRQNMADELTRCIDEDVGTCVLVDKRSTLTVTSAHSLAQLNLVKIPLSVHFSSQHDTAGYCYSVDGRDNGDLLLGCQKGLQLMNKSTGEITSVDLPFKQVNSVVVLHHAIYILHRVDKTCKVEMSLPSLQHQQTLFEFHKEGNYAPSMSVSDRHVVVYYRQALASVEDSGGVSRHLIIYDFITGQTETTKVNTNHSPHCLPDGHLLVAAHTNIRKVKIEDSQLVTIWTCSGLKKVHRVVSDEQGIVYAYTLKDTKLLYIISPEGELLREIQDDRLPSTGGEMYVKDDMLYLPGWHDKKLYTYRLVRQ